MLDFYRCRLKEDEEYRKPVICGSKSSTMGPPQSPCYRRRSDLARANRTPVPTDVTTRRASDPVRKPQVILNTNYFGVNLLIIS